MKMCRRIFAAGALVVAAALLSSGCSRESAPQAKRGGGPPVPVQVAEAKRENVPLEIQAIGNIQAYSTVSIRPQITGPIRQVHFDEGQDVKAGDLLFTIDPRPWQAALNQAEANTKRDEAQLVSARLEFLRTSNLFANHIASRDDYDKAEAMFAAMEATVLADQAAVSNAQISVSYTEIRSPIDGRTGGLRVKAGNVVKAPDDVLLTINQIHPIYALFSMPEQNLGAIQRRPKDTPLPVTVAIPGENQTAQGELTFVNNMVDPTTGTIQLKAVFSNDSNVLWPGQFVQVTLRLSTLADAITVPSHAVQTSQSGDFVFVVKPDMTVEKRPVTTSISRLGTMVVASGLQAGETVVTEGQLRIGQGSKVNVQSGATSSAARAEQK